MTGGAQQAAEIIRAAAPGFHPRIGIVLGSGLGGFADTLAPVASLPYGRLPGFPEPGVAGHAGRLLLAEMGETPVVLLQGRSHYYETGRADGMKAAIRCLKTLGCTQLLLTNAAGSLQAEMPPGSIMLITDHINFTGISPLFGERDSNRFVDMVDAYDPDLCQTLRQAAKALDLTLHEGVYIWFCGPSFETPAEIRAAKTLGADAVGMSTVPEVILARHAGLRVAALSIITNAAAGMSKMPLSHTQTMAAAEQAAESMRQLIMGFLATMARAERV